MPSVSEFKTFLASTLDADSAISDYCLAQWNKKLTIALGSDEREPLNGKENAPYVVIVSGARGTTPSLNRNSAAIRLAICIYEDSKPNKSGNVITYPGTERVDALAVLINKAILEATPPSDKYSVFPIEGPDDETSRPFHKAWLGYQIQFDSEILEE